MTDPLLHTFTTADSESSLEVRVQDLLAQHADQFDPIRFRYIEALLKRRAQLNTNATMLLEKKIAHALSDYERRFEMAKSTAATRLHDIAEHWPALLARAQAYFDRGDFKALMRFADIQMAMQTLSLPKVLSGVTGSESLPAAVPRPDSQRFQDELKSMQLFRESWAKFNTARRVAKTIEGLSEDIGPLNSERLIILAMNKMRSISPDYLGRFLSYADTLLWLDAAANKLDVVPEKQLVKRNKPKR
ncbi:MAG TPA: DUF2894 domain-containing protein [Pseudomonadales bacterium]|nr:DUF2894 domain-containing protein [Pseudomonadales bacterium]